MVAIIGERCRSGWASSTDLSSGVRGGERIGGRSTDVVLLSFGELVAVVFGE